MKCYVKTCTHEATVSVRGTGGKCMGYACDAHRESVTWRDMTIGHRVWVYGPAGGLGVFVGSYGRGRSFKMQIRMDDGRHESVRNAHVLDAIAARRAGLTP